MCDGCCDEVRLSQIFGWLQLGIDEVNEAYCSWNLWLWDTNRIPNEDDHYLVLSERLHIDDVHLIVTFLFPATAIPKRHPLPGMIEHWRELMVYLDTRHPNIWSKLDILVLPLLYMPSIALLRRSRPSMPTITNHMAILQLYRALLLGKVKHLDG